MASNVTTYQCPACTAPLEFKGDSEKLECEYCGSSFEVAEIEALTKEAEQKAAEAPQWDTSDMTDDWGEDSGKMRTYTCPSCSAQLICDETTAATSCPYCGNPTVIPGQFTDTLKPDYVIPFKLTKEDAVKALKKHYAGKYFLPNAFSQENQIQKIQGVYVPFWLFNGQASGNAVYKATRTRAYTSGDYRITETSHFNIFRQGDVSFEKIPVDASTKMPDNYMDSIEPFDYSQLKPFSTAYLPGYLADKYDVSAEDSQARADERCAGTLESALRATVIGYESCIPIAKNIQLNRGKVYYALLPVWLLTTKWEGKDYLFSINGQTGRLAGDLPCSMTKYWRLFAVIAGVLSVLGTAVLALL
jgi:DNA-directed RNA polymerase subunit RPC12/RpoP